MTASADALAQALSGAAGLLITRGLAVCALSVSDADTRRTPKLTLHFLPGYAPELNPDELVWSHAKRTGVARSPLKAGEKLQCRVDSQLQSISDDPDLVRSFFRHPSVSYVSDY